MSQTRNFAQTYKPEHSSTKFYESNNFNKLNVKQMSDFINNNPQFSQKTRGSGFQPEYTEKNFRRIRSEITLQNTPMIQTMK